MVLRLKVIHPNDPANVGASGRSPLGSAEISNLTDFSRINQHQFKSLTLSPTLIRPPAPLVTIPIAKVGFAD
jgi:hypothetical protein